MALTRSPRRLAALAALLLLAAGPPLAAAGAPHCAQFQEDTCVYSKEVALDNDKCHPQSCNFDVEEEFHETCSFAESGTYTYAPAPSAGCADPFMSTRRAGPAPCGERCCRADHVGDFQPDGTVAGSGAERFVYQPTDAGCRYAELTRGQVLHYLRSRGSNVLVVGDSMMRQFYLRVVQMMRGQARLLDYHIHAFAQYAVCGEADAFRLSANSGNASSVVPNNDYLRSKVTTFFRTEIGPGRVAARGALAACSRSPVEFNYMHSPRFKNQVNMVPRFMDAQPAGAKPVLVLSVMYWEGGGAVPQEYLDMLLALRDRARKVFLVSVPTVRVVQAERAAEYRRRNAFMNGWVAEQGEPFAWLDFETVARAPSPPPGGGDNNWHYMCSLSWRLSCAECDLLQVDHANGVGADGVTPAPQIPQGDVERLHATEDGECADEMNRNLWQLVFNTLVAPAGGGDEARRRRRAAA